MSKFDITKINDFDGCLASTCKRLICQNTHKKWGVSSALWSMPISKTACFTKMRITKKRDFDQEYFGVLAGYNMWKCSQFNLFVNLIGYLILNPHFIILTQSTLYLSSILYLCFEFNGSGSSSIVICSLVRQTATACQSKKCYTLTHSTH